MRCDVAMRGWLRRGWQWPARLGLLTATMLGGCSGGVLDPVGPVGAADSKIMMDAFLIMMAIVVPTILLAFWMAWRYRASNTKADYRPYWSYSGRIEALVWSIPILTITFLGGLIWTGSYQLDPFRPLPSKTPTVEVQVVSLDWKWLFIYPKQGVATVNQLVVPAGAPIHFSITSASVFNVFFVPRLGSMVYAMPGMVSQVYLQADRPGELSGLSSQLSGDGFSDMRFQVKSVAPSDFSAWAQSAKASGPALDRAAYADLSRQSLNVKPFSYRSVDPMLFNDIASQAIAPAAGPAPAIRPTSAGATAGGR